LADDLQELESWMLAPADHLDKIGAPANQGVDAFGDESCLAKDLFRSPDR
jgi:hypothetical protein